MKHKTLTALLALASAACLALGLAACTGDPNGPSGEEGPQHAFTADNVCPDCGEEWEYTDGLEYELDAATNTYTVTGIGSASGDIVLPYGHNGKFVTKVGDEAFKGSEAITGIFVPEKIVSVGKAAFASCPNLSSVTWDAADCKKAGITYEEGVSLGQAFDPNDYIIFINSDVQTLTIGAHVKSIPLFAFAACSGIKTATVPDGVTSIDAGAFMYCFQLESVSIGKGVTTIGMNTFADCRNLTSVQWNAENCSTTDSSASSTHEDLFLYCTNLKTFSFGDSVKTIPAYLLYNCQSLESVSIGKNVTSVGEDAFYECFTQDFDPETNNRKVYISDLAAWCKIDFANESSSPLYEADGACLYLEDAPVKELVIPKEITEIKAYTFFKCIGLESITFHDGVTSVGKGAFCNCLDLKSVSVPDLSAWCKIDFADDESNSLANLKAESGHFYVNGEELKELVVPQGITEIKDYAFCGYMNLSSVTFHEGVKSIGSSAFADCKALSSVEIPAGVTSIAIDAFDRIALESITVDANNPNYSSAGGILYNKDKTDIVMVLQSIKGAVTIPSGMSSIRAFMFDRCGELTSVTIPNSVRSIEDSAFYGCSQLTDIQFQGTMQEWKDIQKGWGWDSLTGNYTVTCTNGTLPKDSRW